jgi:ADP-heptose:LPS heptosyltransferase
MLMEYQKRSAPNKGRYLFNNPILLVIIGSIDWFLELFYKSSKEKLKVSPKKILLCCQAHIGDAILASSVVPVIKSAFPQAQIGFLIHPGSIEVLTNNPHVSWVHTFSHWKLNRQNLSFWKKLSIHLKSRSRVVREIKANEYDLAIDLYPYFPNSIPLLFSVKIPLRLGWTSAGFAGLLTHGVDWRSDMGHVVEWHKKLLSTITACENYLKLARPEIFTSEDIKSQWQSISLNQSIPDRFLAFHIGAGGLHRRWQTQHWKQLAELCVNRGESIVLLGHGDEEQAICGDISAHVKNVYDMSGKLTWLLMTEAIAQSELLVGLESASGHIAAARQKPSVSIYSGTTQISIWRPFHPLSRVILHPVPCSPCYMSTGCEGMECIRLTTPETVFSEVTSICK